MRNAVIDTAVAPEREGGGHPYHVYISVHRVADLPETGKGPRDPFVVCEYAGVHLKSSQGRSTCNQSFNECFRIPVVTPIAEDSVLLSLWDWNYMGANELLAQGRISFSDLRAKQIVPRWFNFYGFDPREVPDMSVLYRYGEKLPDPNYYLGRMLVSARCERAKSEPDLMPAQVVASKAYEEPPITPIALVCDVYEVSGIPGSQITVELWCGSKWGRTKWVPAIDASGSTPEEEPGMMNQLYDAAVGVYTAIAGGGSPGAGKHFELSQKKGRVDTLRFEVVEDEKQQYDVLISVYAKGLQSGAYGGEGRVGCHRLKLSQLPMYNPSNPRPPVWIPLSSLPHISGDPHYGAALISLEKARAEDVARARRKAVSQIEYELRCHIYCARNVYSPTGGIPTTYVETFCAGVSAETTLHSNTSNPIYMECLKLKLRLATDPATHLPTVAPIVISVYEKVKGNRVLVGRATCTYDRVRGKLRAGEAPTRLEPRWIRLKGGSVMTRHMGDILLCFELLRSREAMTIPPQQMRPELRSCELWLTFKTLRDLFLPKAAASLLASAFEKKSVMPDESFLKRGTEVRRPIIVVSAPQFGQDGQDTTEMIIPWNPTEVEDPTTINRTWTDGTLSLYSFDVLTTIKMDLMLPTDIIYDPRITIKLFDRKTKNKYLIGETQIPLMDLLPWVLDIEAAMHAIHSRKDYGESVDLKRIGDQMQAARAGLGKGGLLNLGLKAIKEADGEDNQEKRKALTQMVKGQNDLGAEAISSSWLLPCGLPMCLVESYAMLLAAKAVLPLIANMFSCNVFIPSRFVIAVQGQKIENKSEQYFRPSLDTEMEDYLTDLQWKPTRIQRRVGAVKATTGFMQFNGMMKSADGGMSNRVDADMARYAFSSKKLRERFRGPDSYPPVIRVRVYVLRVLALQFNGVANPYLTFHFGDKKESLRGLAKENTLSPHFFNLHEQDITLPDEGRLEVGVASRASGEMGKDTWIGSSVIELEDRWFSKEWQKQMNNLKIPLEYRTLRATSDSTNSVGTLEMWIEMLDLADAQDIPRTELKPPLPTEVELRVIIWGARSLSFGSLSKESIDAKIKVTIDCTTYKGNKPITQETDVHYQSKTGNAVFNWRVVFPQIVLPVASCVIQVAAYDHKNIGSDIFVGEVNLEMRRYLEKLGQTLSRTEVDAELKMINSNDGKADQAAGFIQMTVQMLAQSEASSLPVGLGQESPNRDPRLSPPEDGRSWDDFLQSQGIRSDMGRVWFWVRLVSMFIISIILFFVCFVYPALFWA
eukprot:GHVN01068371.1.p1 GENE.GHVN01068371.1~~GHVN01068371.1.p1  ORF type:complete len:1272 (-),score=174.04 GHVN01068371.1:3383-7198(-)